MHPLLVLLQTAARLWRAAVRILDDALEGSGVLRKYGKLHNMPGLPWVDRWLA